MPENQTVLIVGSGAREHALCWKIGQSPLVKRVLVAPGNGGIPQEFRRNVEVLDFDSIVNLARIEHVDLVVVGPEAPLVRGLVDRLLEEGIRAFGPTTKAAKLEESKSLTKRICEVAEVRTSTWTTADSFYEARGIIANWPEDAMVVKADGLCGGKGVVVAETRDEALEAAYDLLERKIHGDAGSLILIEKTLRGEELSLTAICDGTRAILLPEARDCKALHPGGPNTGGMGAYSPVPEIEQIFLEYLKRIFVLPLLRTMAELKVPYRGILYLGLILTDDGPYLLEINVRLGDPETQVILPRIEDDIVPYFKAATELNGLSKLPPVTFLSHAAVCVNLVSGGYPGEYGTGYPITGLSEAEAHALVLHAGTERTWDELVTDGGRVMSMVGIAETVEEARKRALLAARATRFKKMFYRKDIAEGV